MKIEKAMFGAGCFWHVQAAFDEIKGVKTVVGYAGGHIENPTYKDVCTGGTGHTEVVLIEFEPKKVKYEDLLKVFWKNHDPTQLNKQGQDTGKQYRSVIFYFDSKQKRLAEVSMKDLQKTAKKKIVTEILPAPEFYRAEEYHQKYIEKNSVACKF